MASTPRIAVVGSANADLITFADAFPRAGETVFGRGFDLGFGGISRSLKENAEWRMELLDEAKNPVFRIRLVAESIT